VARFWGKVKKQELIMVEKWNSNEKYRKLKFIRR
jgi:hypothetical protein